MSATFGRPVSKSLGRNPRPNAGCTPKPSTYPFVTHVPCKASGYAPPRRLKLSRSQAIGNSMTSPSDAHSSFSMSTGHGVPGAAYRTSKRRWLSGIRQAAHEIGIDEHRDDNAQRQTHTQGPQRNGREARTAGKRSDGVPHIGHEGVQHGSPESIEGSETFHCHTTGGICDGCGDSSQRGERSRRQGVHDVGSGVVHDRTTECRAEVTRLQRHEGTDCQTAGARHQDCGLHGRALRAAAGRAASSTRSRRRTSARSA